MSDGIRQTLRGTGSSENVLVARKAANGEISSIIMTDTYGVISSLPQIARGADGAPLISGDVVVVINLERSVPTGNQQRHRARRFTVGVHSSTSGSGERGEDVQTGVPAKLLWDHPSRVAFRERKSEVLSSLAETSGPLSDCTKLEEMDSTRRCGEMSVSFRMLSPWRLLFNCNLPACRFRSARSGEKGLRR